MSNNGPVPRIMAMTIVLFMLISSAEGQVLEQQKRIDSLLHLLPQHADTVRFEVLWELAIEHMDFQNEKALEYALESKSLAIKLGDSLRMVRIGRIKMQILYRLERMDEAILEGNTALNLARRNKLVTEVRKTVNSLAISYLYTANYGEALKLLFEGLKLNEQENDQQRVSFTLNNIGLAFYKMKNYSKALRYFDQSLNVKVGIKDSSDLDVLLINMGLCHSFLKNYEKGIKITQEGLNICNSACSPRIQIDGHFGLGVAYFGLNSIPEALAYFQKSYTLAKENKDYRLQGDNLIYLGKIAFQQGEQEKASQYLVEASEIAKAHSYNELLLSAYEALIHIHERNPAKQVLFQEQYIAQREMIYDAELIENLSKVEADYLERENLAQIEHQKEMIALNEQLIEKQQLIALSIGGVLLLILMLILILYKDNRFKRKINELLEQKVLERSVELKESIEDLERAHRKQQERIFRAREDVSVCAESIKFICNQILEHNPEEDTKECVMLMNTTMDQMLKEANRNLTGTASNFNS